MNILITGGTGFIGSHLCRKFINEGHHVVILARTHKIPDNLIHLKYTLFVGDFGDSILLRRILIDIDVVIHTAWSSIPQKGFSDIEVDIQQNIIGSINLMNACLHNNIKKFIFLSSGGTVYGIPKTIPIDESHNLNPISYYGIGKLSVEKYLYLYNRLHNLDYIIFRISNAYGPNQNLNKGQGVIGVWLNKILSNNHIELWGEGTVVRDYIYISDIVDIVNQSIFINCKSKVFNLGTSIGVSLNEIISIIKKVTDVEFKVTHKSSRSFDVLVSRLDINNLKKEFDVANFTSIETGISNTWNWLKEGRTHNTF